MKLINALVSSTLILLCLGPGFNAVAKSKLAGDPVFKFIKSENHKLKGWELAEIVNANRVYSKRYKVDQFWHLCKTAYERGFHTGVGNTFYGDRAEPCYGIECLKVSTVRQWYPKLSDKELANKLLYDYDFAIKNSYRYDAANLAEASKLGYSGYSLRVVGLISYNSGMPNWKTYHYHLSKYLKQGHQLEDLTVKSWRAYHLNFREVYSLHYYIQILDKSDNLGWWIKSCQLKPLGVK